jgi:hypothetical protein
LQEGRFEPPTQRASQIASCVPRGEFECVELSRYLLWGDSLITFSNSPALRSLLLARLGSV